MEIANRADYFETLGDRTGLLLENVSESSAAGLPYIGTLAQHKLIFQEPGALFEMPIRCQGAVVGALWCECTGARRWTASEKAAALSVSLLTATAIDSQQQQQLSASLAIHTPASSSERLLSANRLSRPGKRAQRFIQGIIDASTNILYVDSFVDGSNFYISRWIKHVLGYEPAEVQRLGPQYLEQLVHADEKKHMAKERRKLAAINDGEVVENEYRSPPSSGQLAVALMQGDCFSTQQRRSADSSFWHSDRYYEAQAR